MGPLAAIAVAALLPGHGATRMASGDSEWPAYGRSDAEQRFSPVADIDARNIGRLGVAWYHEFDTDRGQEATPLVVGGVLYVSTAWSKVHAFDAATGRLLWSYDPEVPAKTLFSACCDAVNRGVAVAEGRLFVGTLDGRLIALDMKTGKPLWSQQTTDPALPYTITGAPHVVKGRVIIGNGGAEYAVRGYVSAYDAATGKLAWRFYTVPNPQGRPDGQPSDKPLREKAASTWFGDGWKKMGGGGTVWDSMAYDAEADLLYFGVGNGGPFDIGVRSDGKGDNLFLSSIVAVRPTTGEYVWHYQTTPGDAWDYTATQHMILADLTIDGRRRKVILQAPKNGFFYVLDRLTGQLLSATPYVPVNWASGVDPKTGRPNVVPGARYLDKPRIQTPGPLGGHSWHPMAYNPRTGLVYIPAQHTSGNLARAKSFSYRPGRPNIGLDTSRELPDDPKILAQARAAFRGELIAWDPVARKARWSVRHPYFLNGGVLATAGGLVFQGTAEGEFVAYDAGNGRRLWSYPAGNGIIAPPISYKIGGRQYVAVMVGYGGFGAVAGMFVPDRPRLPGRLLVFALDGKTSVPAFDIPEAPAPDIAGVTSRGNPRAGAAAFSDSCFVCHGLGANSRFTADLRRSPVLLSEDAWRAIVLEGALEERGMVGFARYLSPEDAEDIRAFVLERARKLQAQAAPPEQTP